MKITFSAPAETIKEVRAWAAANHTSLNQFVRDCLEEKASELQAGCDTIYSEDMADGAVYGSVRIVNPFKERSGKAPAAPKRAPSRSRKSKS